MAYHILNDDCTSSQFGNMLVLAATYKSSQLNWLMPKSTLISLLQRTIKFLDTLSPISTTLRADAEILKNVLSIVEQDANTTTSSFSSQNDRSTMSM